MRKVLSITIAALLGTLGAGIAQAEVSGNFGATSNYLWRGVTQSGGKAAVSGGLDYASDVGFYAGAWVSTVDFDTTTEIDGEVVPAVDDTTYEADLYFGFGGEIGDFGYDLNYAYYGYPDGEDIDFGELKGTLSYSVLSAGVAYGTNAQDNAKAFDGSLYYFADLAFELKKDLTLGFHVGMFDGDTPEFETVFGDDSYVDYNVNLTKTTTIGDVSFMVSDTDIDEDDPRVAISWKTTFDL